MILDKGQVKFTCPALPRMQAASAFGEKQLGEKQPAWSPAGLQQLDAAVCTLLHPAVTHQFVAASPLPQGLPPAHMSVSVTALALEPC